MEDCAARTARDGYLLRADGVRPGGPQDAGQVSARWRSRGGAEREDDRGRHPPQERPRSSSAGAAVRSRISLSAERAFSVTPRRVSALSQVVQVVDVGRAQAVA